MLTLVMYVVSIAVLAALTFVSYQWNPRVGGIVGACLVGALIPIGAVWST